jgi:CRP-like cAMP-binding protein
MASHAHLHEDTHVHSCLRENVHTQNLPPRLVNILASVGNFISLQDGEYLFRQGDPANSIYLVCTGSVWLQARDAQENMRVWTVGRHDLVGWSCLTPPFSYLLDARAAGPVTGVRLDAVNLRERIQNDHELGFHLFQILLYAASQRLAPYLNRKDAAPWPHPLIW